MYFLSRLTQLGSFLMSKITINASFESEGLGTGERANAEEAFFVANVDADLIIEAHRYPSCLEGRSCRHS